MNDSEIRRWKEQVEAARRQKDEFFANHPQSPVFLSNHAEFPGLQYYPPDPQYFFELLLSEHTSKESVKVADTVGNMRNLFRWGEFQFQVGTHNCILQAYKAELRESRLFVPFKDATNGTETYGAGRYIDLDAEIAVNAEGKWILDLNDAYNPWCAYSHDYACPFVPPENWLKVPVRAGEKAYPAAEGEEGKAR